MKDICEATGMSRGGLYSHFGSTREVFEVILKKINLKDEMDENGNYQYGYFDCYFTEPERKAYFILDDTVLVGFAMLNPYSYIEHHPDMVIAEFCIFPSYRRKHIATEAAQMILDLYSGNWEIKFNERNTGAKKLWEKVTARYMPDVYHINDDETVLEFSNK